MKKELLIYLAILFVLSVATHPDFITHPITRIENLPHSGAYGLGVLHPLVFSFIIYFLIFIIRFVIKKVKIIFSK